MRSVFTHGALPLLTLLSVAQLTAAAEPSELHVDGLHVVNSQGHRVLLRGVNCAGLEFSTDGEGHILDTVNEAIHHWHVNVIRLPVSQDRWFGFLPDQHDGGAAYRALVEKVVHTVTAQNTYLIFDLHWNDAGVWGPQTGQHVMPDDNSLTFWRDAARTFRNEPGVLFDLYNEPHNVTWDAWKNGGMVMDNGPTVRHPTRYHTPGMQEMLDTVRAQGAKNLIVCGGLDWAYDMSGFLKGYTLNDPYGNGVIYANHTYTVKGDTIEKWLAKVEPASKKIPIIFSEFGNETRPGATRNADWLARTLKALHDHHWSWTAWDLHPAAGPRLVSDWNYTPTPSFGTPVKKELETAVGP